jgi:fatty acid desaturase
MDFHHEELEAARDYTRGLEFEGLSDEQMKLILERGRSLHKWFRDHPLLHALIGAAVIALLFAADFWTLLRLPALILPAGAQSGFGRILAASLIAGSIHSYIMYSLVVYSLHEGAAHKIIFPPKGRLTQALHWISSNLCRLGAGEPNFYSTHHMAHHARFGTEDDGEFLNYVPPERYWKTFFPLAAFLNISDFVIHRPLSYTPSRIVSAILALIYNGVYAWFCYRAFGGLFTALTIVLFLPHVGFILDRMRQFTEHNLMPLENKNGSRSFGVGFWGLLVGGGPWGSPCHWEHHLVPSVPWYQQIMLHGYVKTLLTPRQREQFLIEPVTGFPRLWWSLIRRPQ